MSVRTTMPPMPPMGGMPGMPAGGMGMAPPAPMGGSMAPMGAPMAPMGAPMPPQMPAPSASAGTLPSPSSAGQRAGFRQFAGAIQNMKAPMPSMGQGQMAPMGPMGSMPQDIFGMPMGGPAPMGSMSPGGMPVPALAGRMPDAGRRAVGMKDGGLAGGLGSVAYMQNGGIPDLGGASPREIEQYYTNASPSQKALAEQLAAAGLPISLASHGSLNNLPASAKSKLALELGIGGLSRAAQSIIDFDAIASSADPKDAAQAAAMQVKTSELSAMPTVNNLPGNILYNPVEGAYGTPGKLSAQVIGDRLRIVSGSGDLLTNSPLSSLRADSGDLEVNLKHLLNTGVRLADIQAAIPDVDLSSYAGLEQPLPTSEGDFLRQDAASVLADVRAKELARQPLDNFTSAMDLANSLQLQIDIANGVPDSDPYKATMLNKIQAEADRLAQFGFNVDTRTGQLLSRPDVPLVSGVRYYPDSLKAMMSPATQAAYYSRFSDGNFNTGSVTSGTSGTTGFVGGTGVTGGGGSGVTGGGAGSTFTEIGGGVGSGTVGGGIFAPPAGSGYEPTGYDAARFVQGMSDIYGTRPVSYIGSPEVAASGPLGTINLPARPETVNIYDWLSQSVFDYDPTRVGARLYRDGGEVSGPFDPPRRTDIRGQDHMLAYITPHEAGILKALGGTGEAGPMGIPSYPEPGYGTGGMGDPAGPSGGGQSSGTGGGGADSGQAAEAADAAADSAADSGGGFVDAFGNEYGSATEAAVADAVAEAAADAANAAMGQAGTGGYGVDAAAAVADALGIGPSGTSGVSTTSPSQPSMSVVDQLSTMMNPSQPADISVVDPMTSSQFAPTRGQSISAPTAPDTTPAVSMSPASITSMSDIANMVAPENVDDPLGLMSTPAISLSSPENDQVASRGTGTSQMSVSPASISDIFAEDVAMSQAVAPSMPGGLSSVAPSMDTAPTGLFSAPAPSAQTDISQPSTPSSIAPAPVAPPSSYGPPAILSVDTAPVSAPTVDVAPSGLSNISAVAPTGGRNLDADLSIGYTPGLPTIGLDEMNEFGLPSPTTAPSATFSTTSQATNVSPETIAEDLAPTTTPSTTTQTTMTTRPEMRPDVNLSLKDQIDMGLTSLMSTLTGKTQEQINEELGKKGYTPAEISMFNAMSTNTQRGVAEAVENQIGAGDELLKKVVTDTEDETDGEEKEKVPFSTGETYVPETLEEIMARITSPTTLGRRLNVTSGGPNVFFPSGSRPVRMQEGGEPNYRRMARDFATEYGVDPDIFTKLVIRESGFNPNAKSEKGAFGLTQVMPDTARKPGFGVKPLENMNDPREQLRFGAEYLSAMLKEFGGDYPQALAAYNAGVGAVREAGGVPNFDETRKYVDYILGTTRPKARPGSVSPAPEGVTRPRVRPENLADLLASLERPRAPSRSLRPQMRPSPTISSQDRFAQLDAAASGKDSLGMAVDSFLKSMAAE